MKKFFILICMLLQVIATMADPVEIDGMKYDLNVEEKTASISSYNNYSGILVIPEKVSYNDVDYVVTDIASYAFYENWNLLSVTIPNSVKHISEYAFYQCSSLASVKVGDCVETIGALAFYNCGLVSITIGKNVKSISDGAFSDCYNLTQVYISDLAAWCHIEFNNSSSNPLIYSHHLYLDKKEVKDLVIPEGITEIKKYAFAGAQSISTLNLGNTISSIEQQAFYDCINLESVLLPDAITTIGSEAFFGCSKLENLKLPENLKIIKNSAFKNCKSLTNVTIPSQVEFIFQNAFTRTGTPLSIVMKPEYPPVAYTPVFPVGTKIIVPDESLDLYASVSPWSEYDIITLSGYGLAKCAAPEITYRDGKIIFSCQTPDVEYHYTLTSEDFAKKRTDKEVPLSAVYQVMVYASKAGCEDSEIVSKTIDITSVPTADLNNDKFVNAADVVKMVNIIMGEEVYPKDQEE